MTAAPSTTTTIEPSSPSDCDSFSSPLSTSAIDKSSADGLVEVTVECLAGAKADEEQWIHQLTHLHQASDCMSETSSVEDIRERLDTLFASYPASSSSTDPPSSLTSPHWSVRTLVNSSGPAPRPRNRDSITTTTTSSSHDIERSNSSLSHHKIRLAPANAGSLSAKDSSRLIPSNRSSNKYGPAPTAPPTRSLPLPPVISEIDTQHSSDGGHGDESGYRPNKSSITFPLPPHRSSSPATSHRSTDVGGKRSTDSNSKNRGRTLSQEHKQQKREQFQKSISNRRRSRSRGNGSDPSHKDRKDQARVQSSLAAAAKIHSHRSPNAPSLQPMDNHKLGSKANRKSEALKRLDTQNIQLDSTLSQCSTTDDHAGYQTWKVSSDDIDDDEGDNDVFSQTFGSPLTEKHPSPFGTPSPRMEAEGHAQRFQRMHRNDTPPKISSPRGPLLLSEEQRHGEEMSVSNASVARQAGRTGNSTVQPTFSPFSTVNSTETTVHRSGVPAMRGRELKLAHLRAQQQLLLLEQQRLEQQDSDVGSPDSGVDTEMTEPNESFPGDRPAHDQHRDFVGGVVGSWTKVHQEAPPSRSVTSPAPSRKVEKQVPRAQAAPPQDDRAVEYEVSSLRAQVAQLQFALKRQMNDGSSRGYRGAPNNESMGLPTPEQSFSGGSVYDGKAYNPSVGTFGAPVFGGGGNSERQQAMYPYTTSAGSFMDDILHHQSRHGHMQPANSRQASNGASSNRTAVPSRYDSNQSVRNDHSFALSALRNVQNGSQMFSEPSLADEGFSNRSGDVRVDELSAKLERLEELFRMSALNNDMMRSASPTMDRRTSMATPTPTQDGVMSRHAPNAAPSHQHHQQHHAHAQQHDEQRSGQYGPVRSSSISSASATSSRGGKGVGGSAMGTDFSVGTRSPAASAFMFNATPYPRSGTLPIAGGAGGSEGSHNTHHQYHHSATISALNLRSGDDAVAKNRLTSSPNSAQNNDGSSASRPIAVVPRKGVARFILGTTAKLADATDGKEVPSVQVSWSRKRSERIEKPKAKVKAAGRGRVVIVKDDK